MGSTRTRALQNQTLPAGRLSFLSKQRTRHDNDFYQAVFCFEHAGLKLERLVAYAYLLRRTAQRIALKDGQSITKNEAYFRAAESFVVCAGLSSLGKRLRYFELAADCFSLTGGSHASAAATAYHCAEKFTQAAVHFKQAGMFDEVVDVILFHRDKVDAKVAERCLSIAKLHFHREGQFQ